nr:MAG TPA: hypothetical protein [Caudoviricetes sp.]
MLIKYFYLKENFVKISLYHNSTLIIIFGNIIL